MSRAQPPGPALVIGIGHPDRGDDAVGRIVAGRLNERPPVGFRVVETDGEAAKLIDLFGGADDVIIVDAGRSGAAAGTIHRLDAAFPLPRPMFAMSSHALGLVESVELARTLGQLPERCIVFAVEAARFDLGAGLSPAVAEAVDDVVARVLEEIGAEVT
ncbi:MAG: hydrogenase maturation protease [Bauldia sp.]